MVAIIAMHPTIIVSEISATSTHQVVSAATTTAAATAATTSPNHRRVRGTARLQGPAGLLRSRSRVMADAVGTQTETLLIRGLLAGLDTPTLRGHQR
jgi:hypothetical protein